MTVVKFRRPGVHFNSNLDKFGSKYSDLWDEFFNESTPKNKNTYKPRVNVTESDSAFAISLFTPGVKRDDLNIEVEKGVLTVSGERKYPEENGEKYHRVESGYGSFERVFQLPDSVDQEKIEAHYEDGVLVITLHKEEKKAAKTIDVK